MLSSSYAVLDVAAVIGPRFRANGSGLAFSICRY